MDFQREVSGDGFVDGHRGKRNRLKKMWENRISLFHFQENML